MDLLIGKPKPKPRPATDSPEEWEDSDKKPVLPTRIMHLIKGWCAVVIAFSGPAVADAAHLVQQPANVWITWANQTGRQDFCLALQSATSPFRTCLIGTPLNYSRDLQLFEKYVSNLTRCKDLFNDTPANTSRCLIQLLNMTNPSAPQELQLLGSEGVPNSQETCIGFAGLGVEGQLGDPVLRWYLNSANNPYWDHKNKRPAAYTLVNPTDTKTFSWTGPYCGYTDNITLYNRPNPFNWTSHSTLPTGETMSWSSASSCSGSVSMGPDGLPICWGVTVQRESAQIWVAPNRTVYSCFPCTKGERSCSKDSRSCCCNITQPWPQFSWGYPIRVDGEEAGKLWVNVSRVLPPGVFLICGDRAWQGIPRKAIGGPCYLGRLTILSPKIMEWMKVVKDEKHLTEDCGDEVRLRGTTAHIFASIIPSVGAAHVLKEIERLACWSAKQANVTSQLLTELLMDVDGIRHAVLQNRAAVDFLLLAQAHGCQDFEGMCCFNLSDHSESMHKRLDWLKEHVNKTGTEDDPFGHWLSNVFGNIGP